MAGETDLTKMLATMAPELFPDDYVFCSLKTAVYGDHPTTNPIATFQEAEGLTLVVTQGEADRMGWSYDSTFKRITLTIHSSLDAVGLTAAFATKLGEHGISANVIAGYYHDHIFVQSARAEQAMAALRELAADAQQKR